MLAFVLLCLLISGIYYRICLLLFCDAPFLLLKYSGSMGNSLTSRSSFRMKCIPNGKRLPDASSKIGSDASPSDSCENQVGLC